MKLRDASLQVYKKKTFHTSFFMYFAFIFLECITITSFEALRVCEHNFFQRKVVFQLNSCNSNPQRSQSLFELHSNYSSRFFRPILLKKARGCKVQAKEEDKFFFTRNIYFAVNSYHKYCTRTETIISTVYCLGKFCFILSNLL